jgi:hypothetical protein
VDGRTTAAMSIGGGTAMPSTPEPQPARNIDISIVMGLMY